MVLARIPFLDHFLSSPSRLLTKMFENLRVPYRILDGTTLDRSPSTGTDPKHKHWGRDGAAFRNRPVRETLRSKRHRQAMGLLQRVRPIDALSKPDHSRRRVPLALIGVPSRASFPRRLTRPVGLRVSRCLAFRAGRGLEVDRRKGTGMADCCRGRGRPRE